jgi:hypothetical protein
MSCEALIDFRVNADPVIRYRFEWLMFEPGLPAAMVNAAIYNYPSHPSLEFSFTPELPNAVKHF